MKNIMFTFCSHFNSPIQKCFEYTFVRGRADAIALKSAYCSAHSEFLSGPKVIGCDIVRPSMNALKPKSVLFDQAWIVITDTKGVHRVHVHLS